MGGENGLLASFLRRWRVIMCNTDDTILKQSQLYWSVLLSLLIPFGLLRQP